MTSALRRAVDARHAFTLQLVGRPTVKPIALTGAQAYDRLFGWVYKDNPDWPTIEKVRDVATRVIEVKGMQEYTWCLQRFGVQTGKVADMWIGSWQRFVAECEAMLILNSSFGAPYRWLIWHPESDALFEETSPIAVVDMITRECADDVSGIAHHEALYAKQQCGEVIDEL